MFSVKEILNILQSCTATKIFDYLRWPNTGFAHALVDVIQHTHTQGLQNKKHAVDSAIILLHSFIFSSAIYAIFYSCFI